MCWSIDRNLRNCIFHVSRLSLQMLPKNVFVRELALIQNDTPIQDRISGIFQHWREARFEPRPRWTRPSRRTSSRRARRRWGPRSGLTPRWPPTPGTPGSSSARKWSTWSSKLSPSLGFHSDWWLNGVTWWQHLSRIWPVAFPLACLENVFLIKDCTGWGGKWDLLALIYFLSIKHRLRPLGYCAPS